MFISAAGFKKLVKEAYRNGSLRLGNNGYGILIAGSYWAMCVDEAELPKKAKAAIIELTGIIPEAGEMYHCTKEGNQMEMGGTIPDVLYMSRNAIEAEEEMEDTKVILCEYSKNRILQNTKTGKIVKIQDECFRMIDKKLIKENESFPVGPNRGENGGIYWHNNCMAFLLMPVSTGDNMLEKSLERININEYRKTKISKTEDKEEAEEA